MYNLIFMSFHQVTANLYNCYFYSYVYLNLVFEIIIYFFRSIKKVHVWRLFIESMFLACTQQFNLKYILKIKIRYYFNGKIKFCSLELRGPNSFTLN